jgi:hypothetical protein
MPNTQPAFRATSPDHQHAANETCPYCEQPIPNDRAEEIRARFTFKQKQDEAALKVRYDQQVAAARAEIEAGKKAEIDKLKGDALAQATAAREQGKQAAEAEAQQRLATMAAAQEADKKKLQEVEQQRLEAVNQYQVLKTQTDTIVTARVAEARTAIEKSNAEANSVKDAQNAEAMQKLSDQLTGLQRHVADVEGEGGDIKLYDELRKEFPKDDITKVNKSSGASIIHVVRQRGKECGKIVYDDRNRNIWQDKFATQLRDDMVTAKAQHAILTCSKFPRGVRQIHLCEGVIALNAARALVLAQLLREEVIRNFSQRVSEQDQAKKTVKLYAYITSGEFDKLLGSLENNDEKLLQLDEDEKRAHNSLWDKRRKLATGSQRLHAALRMQVARIVGTDETE